jgi:hypothetical protein
VPTATFVFFLLADNLLLANVAHPIAAIATTAYITIFLLFSFLPPSILQILFTLLIV